jgi:hypothetical protein
VRRDGNEAIFVTGLGRLTIEHALTLAHRIADAVGRV